MLGNPLILCRQNTMFFAWVNDGQPRSENGNNLQAGPNPDEFDVESLRSLRDHSYQGSLNSSQNSESQEDGQ